MTISIFSSHLFVLMNKSKSFLKYSSEPYTQRSSTPHNVLYISNGYRIISESIGKGSFGNIVKALAPNGEVVAIKKCEYRNDNNLAEYSIMEHLDHPNIIAVKDHYITKLKNSPGICEHIVMEYFHESLYNLLKSLSDQNILMDMTFVKLYAYQLFAGLSYIHSKNIIHRDIKPENLLVDRSQGLLKISDFGSATFSKGAGPLETYVISRYYRPPEVILKSEQYGPAVDVWSAACVIYEMVTGEILFKGSNNDDMLKRIEARLGFPTYGDVKDMKIDSCSRFGSTTGGVAIYDSRLPHELLTLLNKILVYNPRNRPTAAACLKHRFFDDLFKPGARLPNRMPIPRLSRS